MFLFFLVLEETHLFDETRPQNSKENRNRPQPSRRVFCSMHPAAKESPERLDGTDVQTVCWGECSPTDKSCGKEPKETV